MTSILSYLYGSSIVPKLELEPKQESELESDDSVIIDSALNDQIKTFNTSSLKHISKINDNDNIANIINDINNSNEFMKKRSQILKNGSPIWYNHSYNINQNLQTAHLYLIEYLKSSEIVRKNKQLILQTIEKNELLATFSNIIRNAEEELIKKYILINEYNSYKLSKKEIYTLMRRQFLCILDEQEKLLLKI